VRAVVEVVEQKLGCSTVFFDEWFEYFLAGADADLKLERIYGEGCALAVVCVSERYGSKPWTRAEYGAIRARYMKAQESQDERARLGILPIRVGDGEVEGILFNTIAPDIRSKTPFEAAQLIIDRLRLVVGEGAAPVPDWPEQPPPLRWLMADYCEVRGAFEHLLTRTASFRFLPLRGPSEVGKTHITNQMLGNALEVPDLACGRFDFKGITDLDAEVRAFVQQLDVPLPRADLRLNERLGHILDELKRVRRPALLLFDTYEAAGEVRDWVEKQLLPSLIRATWLRVVIVGQHVPEPVGAIWEAVSSRPITLYPPPPEDWFFFGQQHDPEITLEFVRQAHRLCSGRVSTLADLCRPKR